MKNGKNKKIGLYAVVGTCLLLCIQTISALPQNYPSEVMSTSGWLYVGGGGPGNYTTIQSAINAASNGDFIYVYSGTYNENLVVDQSLTIIGEDRNITTIQGNNVNSTIGIDAEGVTIQNFTIKNDGSQDGVYTSTSDHIFLDNIFTDSLQALHLYYSSENTIMSNQFYDNSKNGVFIEVGQNNTISGNEFFNNTDGGIYITGCGTTIIEENMFHHNGKGIHAYRANGNIIRNNVLQSNSYGIHFEGTITVHSNYNTISHNTINDNTVCGIRIENSQFNRIEFNEIQGNGNGIQFELTGANIVTENEITQNLVTEITLTFSLADLITKNNIDNVQQSLVLLQINFGFSIASNNWWGSTQWPLRRIRPIGGWVIMMPWRTGSFNLSVGPEP
jgi:parallel beta-helix repeat protein